MGLLPEKWTTKFGNSLKQRLLKLAAEGKQVVNTQIQSCCSHSMVNLGKKALENKIGQIVGWVQRIVEVAPEAATWFCWV